MGALPYTLALLIPAIVLSFWAGNKVGALAARRKTLDNTVLPVGYVLTATPQMWLGIMLAWLFASTLAILPVSGAYSLALQPEWSLEFAGSFLYHWILPFSALFLVAFGGWAIGMRNMIIYELEADYSNYLAALGAPTRLVRKYAYRNALLPADHRPRARARARSSPARSSSRSSSRIPGLGTLTLTAIQNRDYFLIQGIFLFLIVGVLDREPHHRHRVRADRPADARRHAGWQLMSVSDQRARSPRAPGDAIRRAGRRARSASASARRRRDGGARSSSTSRFGTGSSSSASASSLAAFALAIVGPMFTDHAPLAFDGPVDEPPSSEYWFGTTSFGQDVFAQFVYGLRAAFLVGVARRRASRGCSERSSGSPPAIAADGSTTS